LTTTEITLADARNLRAKARKLIAEGIDPMADRVERREKKKAVLDTTFKRVALE